MLIIYALSNGNYYESIQKKGYFNWMWIKVETQHAVSPQVFIYTGILDLFKEFSI